MPRYAETVGIRRASQSNDRQVLPTPMMAHIKANVSATVADDRCMRRCAWPHEYFDPTGKLTSGLRCQVSFLAKPRSTAKAKKPRPSHALAEAQ